MHAVVILGGLGGEIQDAVAHRHLVKLVSARPENGAAYRQDAGHPGIRQALVPILHQPAKSVTDADDLHPVGANGGLCHSANRRIEGLAVSSGRQDADRAGLRLFCHNAPRGLRSGT